MFKQLTQMSHCIPKTCIPAMPIDGLSFCSIVLCIVFLKSVVSASATNKFCASLLNPLCPVWSVEGHFTVKFQAAVSFRGGLREARDSDGPVK